MLILEAYSQCRSSGGELPVPQSIVDVKSLQMRLPYNESCMHDYPSIHLGIYKFNTSSWKGKPDIF